VSLLGTAVLAVNVPLAATMVFAMPPKALCTGEIWTTEAEGTWTAEGGELHRVVASVVGGGCVRGLPVPAARSA